MTLHKELTKIGERDILLNWYPLFIQFDINKIISIKWKNSNKLTDEFY